jgi:homoserine kinase type II
MLGSTIFLLTHEYELDGYDQLKVLGVYSELQLAETAKAYFSTQPGFCDHLDGFGIEECQINKDLWSEGFVTYRFPLDPQD